MQTRRSLLSRLKVWDDQDSWNDFFNTYWKLIYSFAFKAGLNDAEAQEVVQETLISVASSIKDFKYQPERGSFKSWLLLIVQRRITDQLRKRYRAREVGKLNPDETAVAEEINLELQKKLTSPEETWNEAWQIQVAQAALDKVRRTVRPEQFQIYEMYVVRGQSGAMVAKTFGVSLMTVYLAKTRVGKLLKEECKKLEKRLD